MSREPTSLLHLRRYTGPALTAALPRQDGEEMLRAAMAAERSTAARRTEDPFADLGVSFKEVRPLHNAAAQILGLVAPVDCL